MEMPDADKRTGIDGHRRIHIKWGRAHAIFIFLHYTLGPLATVFAVVAASKFAESLGDYWQHVILVVSGCLTALLAFLRAGEQADRYQSAWAHLGNAIDRYDMHEVEAEAVRRACEIGEAIVRYTAPVAMPGANEAVKGGASAQGSSQAKP
jgi:hypothetical protein